MRVILVCSGGMSSAIAAKSLTEAAKDAGIDMEVIEASTQQFDDMVKENFDLALVAPQIRHRFDLLEKFAEIADVPILQIAPRGYSPIGGKFLLAQIKEEAGQIFENQEE